VSTTVLEIYAFVWIAAGVLGFFVGRSGASPGCGWYVLIFIATGVLGLFTFIGGSVLGRNLRRDEMRAARRGPPPLQPARGVRPTPVLPPPGWYRDQADPFCQRYWDGVRWTHQARWNGSEWVAG
jgi:hypothetical protein